ncbi:hypothetical protein FACS1894204_03860 [Synergistales bacterium]|nr:hypothetical protein FACS1894204_03860 [Synergistales bacterium]
MMKRETVTLTDGESKRPTQFVPRRSSAYREELTLVKVMEFVKQGNMSQKEAAEMKKAGLVERVGAAKGGHWVVKTSKNPLDLACDKPFRVGFGV